THVYTRLVEAGYAVDFVSPKGGQVPLDGVDRKDTENAAFLDDAGVMKRLQASLRPDEVDPTRYAAIFYAGGHGTMWDLPDNAALAGITARIYEQGGVAAAVCYGPAGLVNVKLSSG